MSLHVFCHHPWDLISVMAPSSQHYFMHKKVEDAFSHFGPLKKKKKAAVHSGQDSFFWIYRSGSKKARLSK